MVESLSWEHFSELHRGSSVRERFEDLSFSLFKKMFCKENQILHSNPNNPGIEVEPVYDKEGKLRISFQAKFFAGDVSYIDIRNSAEMIIKHYKNKLDVVYLYSNKDIDNTCNSMKEIKKLLDDAYIKLELVTNREILTSVIDYPALCNLYFGNQSFTREWVEENLNYSLKSLGEKFNRKFNIETEYERQINYFLLNNNILDDIKIKINDMLDEINDLLDVKIKQESFIRIIKDLLNYYVSNKEINFQDIIKIEDKLFEEFSDNIKRLQDEMNDAIEQIKKIDKGHVEYKNLDNRIKYIERIINLSNYSIITEYEKNLITSQVLFIHGSYGVGKTQLISNSAKVLYENGKDVLLINAARFFNNEYVENQIVKNLDSIADGLTFDNVLEFFNEDAANKNCKAYIFIDAINESRDLSIWKTGLETLVNKVETYNNIKLVVTIRKGFENYLFLDFINDKIKSGNIIKMMHRGLIDDSLDAVSEFMAEYGIKYSPEYYLSNNMANPLFLKWFCETYDGNDNSYFDLIEKILKKADEIASSDSRENVSQSIIKSLLNKICEYEINNGCVGIISKEVLLGLDIWQLYGVKDKNEYLRSIERFGLLLKSVNKNEEYYSFGYDMVGNYVYAKYIIDKFNDELKVKTFCKNELLNDQKIYKFGNISKFIMITALYSLKYNSECIELIDNINDKNIKRDILRQYYETFVWRNNVTYDLFKKILNKYPIHTSYIFDIFIENATKAKNDLNAEGLCKLLKPLEIAKRDYVWTIYINGLRDESRVVQLIYNYEKGKNIKNINKSEAKLLLLLLSWFLTSSNRVLRDRTSKAMIEILKINIDFCIYLLNEFKEVNDPYIYSRLHGIVFGALMKRKEKNEKEFGEIVDYIYNNIFNCDVVYPNILLRDYARLIIERYFYEFPENSGKYDKNKIIPPYKSPDLPYVKEIDYNSDKFKINGVRDILLSIQPDVRGLGVGMYGDFGRYVYQYAIERFADVDIKNVYYFSMDYILNKLKYNSDYFGSYDASLRHYGRNESIKIERIGKKYQWITMHYVLAILSDHYQLADWNKKKRDFKGNWELNVRDFDPTLNMHFDCNIDCELFNINEYDKAGFISFDASEDEIKKWAISTDNMFEDIQKKFIFVDKHKNEWVSLCFYQENIVSPNINKHDSFYFKKGRQEVWSMCSSYLVKSIEKLDYINEFKDKNVIGKYHCNPIECCDLFNGEYAWSSGYKEEFKHNREDDEEIIGLNIITNTSIDFSWGERYDGSQDRNTSYLIPCGNIINELKLEQHEEDGLFYSNNELVACDLRKMYGYHYNLLIRKDYLDKFLNNNKYNIVWTLVGEKQFFLGGGKQIWDRKEGYFLYKKNIIKGNIESAGMH